MSRTSVRRLAAATALSLAVPLAVVLSPSAHAQPSVTTALGVARPAAANDPDSGVPGRDVRFGPAAEHRPGSAQRAAVAALADVEVAWGRSGTARSVVPRTGVLSKASGGSADAAARRYLRDNPALFGLTPAQVAALRLTMEDAGDRATYLRYQQVSQGRDVYGATGLVVLDSRGRVLRAGVEFVPDADSAPAPTVSAEAAVAAVGAQVAPQSTVRPGRRLGQSAGVVRFENTLKVPDLKGVEPVEAGLVTVDTAAGPRPAWRVNAQRASDADYGHRRPRDDRPSRRRRQRLGDDERGEGRRGRRGCDA